MKEEEDQPASPPVPKPRSTSALGQKDAPPRRGLLLALVVGKLALVDVVVLLPLLVLLFSGKVSRKSSVSKEKSEGGGCWLMVCEREVGGW